ncbi:uncharacterized protein LOC122274659 [Carya illinoinensis]|uniref:uncharacterized protein LOC122274659 n=1 Tax=Carya illinoinensis TaxID=32201 RepID=UPI001C71BC44|nr:uncharacterized protein LOC122274659 [Carya illinoinensis]
MDCCGHKGGIALLWGRDVDMYVLNYSHCHIDAAVKSVSRGGVWFFTGGGGQCVLERLDRALANDPWGRQFPFASVVHGLATYSDHAPIWINTDSKEGFVKHKKLFRFEPMWVREKGCDDIIASIWRKGGSGSFMDSLVDFIKDSRVNLKRWNSNSFGNVQKQLSMAKQRMTWLYENDPLGTDKEAHDEAREEVQKWLERDELMWKQRSKVLWLKEGDSNSKYFHMKASQRRRKNRLVRIKDGHGSWHTGDQRDRVIVSYFEDLFRSSNPNGSLDFLRSLTGKITASMNEDFKYWHLVGPSVIGAVLKALNSGVFPTSINHTHITLMPKKKHTESVADHYRPISLCNVIYKLVAKVISNRLKSILPSVIEGSQCAFVPGRLITDNVLITYELIHFLKHKRKGKKGYMSVKLDMSKAYDRVEWGFIKAVMNRTGFERTFTDLVMSWLIALLKEAEIRKQISGVQICRGAPKITHLLFADDSLIFCKAKVEEVRRLQALLATYEIVSGQKINREKTSLVFSANVERVRMDEIRLMWGTGEVQQYERYLGLPLSLVDKKKRAFHTIKQKFWQKLQCWKEKLLSQGGKEVLLKAVALSIPTYAMSCFLLPSGFCSKLEGLMANFWWGQKHEERRIHWVS